MGSSSCPMKWVLNKKLCETVQAQRKGDFAVPVLTPEAGLSRAVTVVRCGCAPLWHTMTLRFHTVAPLHPTRPPDTVSITTAGPRVQSLKYDTRLSPRLCCQALDIHSGYPLLHGMSFGIRLLTLAAVTFRLQIC